MKEREASASVAAGLLLSVVCLRMLAPELPFDWMTLIMVLMASVIIVLPQCMPAVKGRHKAEASKGTPAADEPPLAPTAEPSREALAALRQRMDSVQWEARTGGLFDSLRSLYEEKPFAALCAARGMLLMLVKQAKPAGEALATVALLCDAMDAAARAGEKAVDSHVVSQLFAYAMRALGWLETIG